ncbi:hypothetical protein [Streptomyces sp. CA-179760]
MIVIAVLPGRKATGKPGDDEPAAEADRDEESAEPAGSAQR